MYMRKQEIMEDLQCKYIQLPFAWNQVQAPTVKNAVSLSSVYSGDNITGKKIKMPWLHFLSYDTINKQQRSRD